MKKAIIFQRVLGVIIAYFSAIAFIQAGFKWYWLFVCFLAYDLSMLGYVKNPRLGAKIYNIGHGLIAPTAGLLIGYAFDIKILLFLSLSWMFHISVDRAFGYGLKKPSSFKHTDLGDLK